MDLVLSQVPGFIVGIISGLTVGIISGLIAGVISGLWVARILERREQQRQVRKVTADVTRTWAPVPGESNMKVMTGGYLTIRNSSDWPVREVIVMEPDWLDKFHLRYLGPGREHVEPIPQGVLLASREIDPPVTLQLTTIRDRVYQWRPATDELFDLRWIPLQSRPVQRFAQRYPRVWSRLFHPLMMKLPDRALIWVWGYHPASGERRSKNPKGQPLV